MFAGSGILSWIASSSHIISGTVELADQLSNLLAPADTDLTPDERQLLFNIQSHLAAILQPLRLCYAWSRDRVSCVYQVVEQVETILRTTMATIHPLLLGQRPVAAASYVARKGATSDAAGGGGGGTAAGGSAPTLPMSEGKVRATLKAHLLNCVQQLQWALQLINTALNTIQTIEIVNSKPNRGQGTLCLVTLLKAYKKFLAMSRCSGDLFVLRGRWLVRPDLIHQGTACEEFQPQVSGNRPSHPALITDESTRETLEFPVCIDAESQPGDSTELSSTWHWLPGTHEVHLRAHSKSNEKRRRTSILFRPVSVNRIRVPLCDEVLKAGSPFIQALMSHRGATLSMATAKMFSRVEQDPVDTTAVKSCSCWNYGSSGQWETLTDNEDQNSFEHVSLELNDTDQTAPGGTSDCSQPPPPPMTFHRRSFLALRSSLFRNPPTADDSHAMILVVDTVVKEAPTLKSVLEFIYLARMLHLAHDSLAPAVDPEHWLDQSSHELLQQIFEL